MADSFTIQLTLTASPSAPKVPLTISKTDTPSQLRSNAATATKIPLGQLRLIFRGRLIADDSTKQAAVEYKLEEGCVVHCMGKPVAAGAAAPAAAAVPASAGATMSTTAPAGPAATTASASPASAAPTDPLATALLKLKSSNAPAAYLTAITTLDKILSNIVNNPMEAKYRKVKKGNAAFQKRLSGLVGGAESMLAAGFVSQQVDGDDCYVLEASAEAWPQLMAAKTKMETAVRDAKAMAATPSAAATSGFPGAAGAGAAGMGGFGGFPAPGGAGGMPQMTPQMQQMAQQMMSNPQQLQAMLQNPMVQQMLQNDPRFANNPMAQESMRQLANNPQMLQQMSQMMADPAMMAQMNQMMGAGGAGGGMPSWMPPMGGGAATASSGGGATASSNTNNAGAAGGNNQSGQSDQDMTEEELLQEAIRRSLRES